MTPPKLTGLLFICSHSGAEWEAKGANNHNAVEGHAREPTAMHVARQSESFLHRVFTVRWERLPSCYLRSYKRVSCTLRMKISGQTSALGEGFGVFLEPFFRFPD